MKSLSAYILMSIVLFVTFIQGRIILPSLNHDLKKMNDVSEFHKRSNEYTNSIPILNEFKEIFEEIVREKDFSLADSVRLYLKGKSLHKVYVEAMKHPIGQFVNVDGHKMNVYTEGTGNRTIVFMAGLGTASPILDFKTLYSLLSDDYKIAVIEKYGYGFSDIVSTERSVKTMVRQDREALAKAGVEGPFILCPHSMGGLEAVYWAKKYPEEVESVIGLDIIVPNEIILRDIVQYTGLGIASKLLSLLMRANSGIPELADIADHHVKRGNLTDEEFLTEKALFYERGLNKDVLKELDVININTKTVSDAGIPQVPMLLFYTDVSLLGEEVEKYILNIPKGRAIHLDCGHYLHNLEPGRVNNEIRAFLDEIDE